MWKGRCYAGREEVKEKRKTKERWMGDKLEREMQRGGGDEECEGNMEGDGKWS